MKLRSSILFDVSFLSTCLANEALTGIDQIDLEYALHFARSESIAAGVHYTFGRRPHFVDKIRVADLADRVEAFWRKESASEANLFLDRVEAWLTTAALTAPARRKSRNPLAIARAAVLGEVRKVNPWAFPAVAIPTDRPLAYVNVAQHLLQFDVYFRWLNRFPSIRPIFFLHDLLPLDHPEFWAAGHRAVFQRIVDTMLRYADAFITSSEAVKSRLEAEMRSRSAPLAPILASALPAPLHAGGADAPRPGLSRSAYFVVLGTIEPRKNHLLLLNLWRSLADAGGEVPKLVIAGRRGWENEQVIDMLERCPQLKGHVLEAGWTPASALRELIRNARGLLMPSYAEGFGLPMVEALALGTPVLASDMPIARESTQNCALYRHALDGLGWREAILALAKPNSETAQEARRRAAGFRPADRPAYFASVEAFVAELLQAGPPARSTRG